MNAVLPGSAATMNAQAAGASRASRAILAERQARIEVRRAFVQMKQAYMRAASDVAGAPADLLLHRVRRASEPWELWSVRAVILAALPAEHERTAMHRSQLERAFDSIFHASGT